MSRIIIRFMFACTKGQDTPWKSGAWPQLGGEPLPLY
jgi:hypothetical protein